MRVLLRALTARFFLLAFALLPVACLDPGAGEEEGETLPSVDVSYLLYTLEGHPERTCIFNITYIPNTPEGEGLAKKWAPDLQKEVCNPVNIDIDKMKGTEYHLTVKSSGEVIDRTPSESSDYLIQL
jgi:hypothetical protein